MFHLAKLSYPCLIGNTAPLRKLLVHVLESSTGTDSHSTCYRNSLCVVITGDCVVGVGGWVVFGFAQEQMLQPSLPCSYPSGHKSLQTSAGHKHIIPWHFDLQHFLVPGQALSEEHVDEQAAPVLVVKVGQKPCLGAGTNQTAHRQTQFKQSTPPYTTNCSSHLPCSLLWHIYLRNISHLIEIMSLHWP